MQPWPTQDRLRGWKIRSSATDAEPAARDRPAAGPISSEIPCGTAITAPLSGIICGVEAYVVPSECKPLGTSGLIGSKAIIASGES